MKTLSQQHPPAGLLRAAVELSPLAVAWTDGRGRIEYVSESFCELSGYRREEVIGQRAHLFVALPENGEEVREALRRVQSGEDWRGPLRLQAASGGGIDLRLHARRVEHEGAVRYVCVLEDARREASLLRRLQAVQKMEALGTLVSGIAHRFNNILASIMGHAELIGMQAKEEPAITRRTEKILQSAENGKNFVAEMMAFSRKSDSQQRRVDIGLVARSAARFIETATPRTLEVVAEVPDAQYEVLGISDDLHQVVVSLLTNAVQATEGVDSPRIELTVQAGQVRLQEGEHAPEAPAVSIRIADNGPGVPPELVERIFEPFFTTHNRADASGMGLAVAHGMVKRHGGRIELQPGGGPGAVFTIHLPRLESEEAVNSEPHGFGHLPRGTERILLVDDEPLITAAGKEFLEMLGYKVREAHCPLEALELVCGEGAEAFDLLVTDLTMPKLSGVELAEQIRASGRDLPVLVCSGYNENLSEEARARAGIVGLLDKPCPVGELAAAVRRTLDRREG